MGKVLVQARIENLNESYNAKTVGQRLIGNPAHGGEHMAELY